MNAKLAVIIFLIALLLVGCTPTVETSAKEVLPEAKEPVKETAIPTDELVVEEPCEPVVKEYTLTVKPVPSEPEEPLPEPEEESIPIVVNGQPPSTRTWISPGKVQIGNFHAGARAEWVMTINNGLDTTVDKFEVISGANDPIVKVRLKYPLYKDSLGFVIKVDSTIEEEELTAISYKGDTQMLTVEGLVDNRDRIIGVAYQYGMDRTFNINYEEPHHIKEPYAMPPEEAKDWFIVSDSSIILAPEEKTDVLLALVMPEGTTAPPKWEFWVLVTRKTGANVETNLASRWLVDMRPEEQ